MHTGGRLVVTTPKAGQIRDLINQYLIEANSGQYDYVKALAEFSSKDESALTFKKGEIIGNVGSSGRSTGTHKDIRLKWFGTRLDPATILNIM